MKDMHYLVRRVAENIMSGGVEDLAHAEPLHTFLVRRPNFALWLSKEVWEELLDKPESFWLQLWSS